MRHVFSLIILSTCSYQCFCIGDVCHGIAVFSMSIWPKEEVNTVRQQYKDHTSRHFRQADLSRNRYRYTTVQYGTIV